MIEAVKIRRTIQISIDGSKSMEASCSSLVQEQTLAESDQVVTGTLDELDSTEVADLPGAAIRASSCLLRKQV
jgi:hypothetical protein